MTKPYMGQIMAECDCQHAGCEDRGYCMADRIATITEQLEAARRDAKEDSAKWQPIETAPRDGTRVLLFRQSHITGAQIVFGRWNDDRFRPRPRPYWTHDLERVWGVTEAREAQPTHWMPPPEPPKESP